MADSTTTDLAYTPTTWADGADGGTAITAARLNNLEQGVAAATTQVNANTKDIKTLGDSVSQIELVGVTSITLSSAGDTDSPYLYVGFHLSTGYEFRLVCQESTIHLDRIGPSGNGVQMWSK